MSYIDAMYHKRDNRLYIVERIDGVRRTRAVTPELVLHVASPNGQCESIFGERYRRERFTNWRAFEKALTQAAEKGRKVCESDIDPMFRYLAKHYMGVPAPELHVAFFDIEVGFDPDRGFAPPNQPFNPVTAISLYLTAEQRLYSLVLAPPTLSPEAAQAVGRRFDDTGVFTDEAALLDAFLSVIADVDCILGWNSEQYDLPYLVNRVRQVLGEEATKQFCLWAPPRAREYSKFQRNFQTYELNGRVHLDYLLLYQKHNTQQQHSYRLDFIGEIEVGETKTPYSGTLDELYKQDFEKFIAYNRQDTMLLVKIDGKRKFLDLANQIAHVNCVLLKTTMGSVTLIEQAIINEMHAMGYIVPDRKPVALPAGAVPAVTLAHDDDPPEPLDDFDLIELVADDADDEAAAVHRAPGRAHGATKMAEGGRTPVVGAFVIEPRAGLHRWIGAIDVNSLYPSTIRAFNMSPETVFGQVVPSETMALVEARIAAGTPRAEAWEGIFHTLEVGHMLARDDAMLDLRLEETGELVHLTGAELYELVFQAATPSLCISANGTLFKTDRDGMIPRLLAKWYAERKDMQATQKDYAAMAAGIEISADLAQQLAA